MGIRTRAHNLLGRSPSDTGSDLAFGPGGQIKIVSDPDSHLHSTDISQNLAPQTVQETASLSQISQSQASQPLTSLPPEQTVTVNSILSTTDALAVTSVASLTSSPSSVSVPVASTPSSALLSTPVVSSLVVSSIPASPTVETTASATTASSAAASPSTSATTASTGHSPPFYVGIVTGIIIIIACVAALVAWWIRMRSRARRRRLNDEVAGVPWAKSEHGDPLGGNREVTFIGSGNHPALGVGPSSQNPMEWEPRGDRDVGEPKRTDSFLNASVSSAPYNPFATQFPASGDNAPFHLPLYNTYAKRQLPTPHLPRSESNPTGSVDAHASINSLGPLQVANRIPGDVSVGTSRAPSMLGVPDDSTEFGTPHVSMAGSRPRFLGLEGGGLGVPWAPTTGSFSRNPTSLRGGYGAGSREHLPSLPMPATSNEMGAADTENWTASLKMNLMNAFNAVAAGLPSAPTMEERQENYLTPCPPRYASHVGSLSRADRGDDPGHRLIRESTVSSKSWTLEERLDGTGTVRFHGLEGYRGGDHAFSPMPSGSSLTLQDEDRSYIGGSIYQMTTHESQTPLIINRKPKTAVLRPGFYGRISQYGYGRKPGLVSRASSVYSTVSGTSSVLGRPNGRASNPFS